MAEIANSLKIRNLAPNPITDNYLSRFSTMILFFYSLSYCPYFHKNQYHWYHRCELSTTLPA